MYLIYISRFFPSDKMKKDRKEEKKGEEKRRTIYI
jgi:hypothetical protein